MNNPFSIFFETREICPEPRIDVVPRVCMVGLLAFLIGLSWFFLVDKLVDKLFDTTEHNSVIDLDTEEVDESSSGISMSSEDSETSGEDETSPCLENENESYTSIATRLVDNQALY